MQLGGSISNTCDNAQLKGQCTQITGNAQLNEPSLALMLHHSSTFGVAKQQDMQQGPSGLDGQLPVEQHVSRGAAGGQLVHLENRIVIAQVPGILALHV